MVIQYGRGVSAKQKEKWVAVLAGMWFIISLIIIVVWAEADAQVVT